MNVHDWALIAFTILLQMSVGAIWVLGAAHYFATRKYGMEEADRLSDRALMSIGPLVVLGLITSLFHLGNPLGAYRAVTNLDTSWLSREILLAVIFALLGVVFAFMQWRKIASFVMRNLIAWLAAVVGLGLVFSMSNVYLLPTQPAWNSWVTPVSFFTTTFLLGLLAVGVAFVANYAYVIRVDPGCEEVQCTLMRTSLRWIAIAAILLLGIDLVVLPLSLASLAGGPEVATKSAQLIIGGFVWVLVLRIVLGFVGAGVFTFFLYPITFSAGKEKTLSKLAYASFVLVLIAEAFGRFLFYATHVRIGI